MSNFEFLKQINKDLFKIAAEAEELFATNILNKVLPKQDGWARISAV